MTMRSIFLLLAACSTFAAAELTRQECTDQGGQVIGDIGNGAIFQPNYVCASNGLPPIDVVVPSPNEPIATEGEVCCGPSTGTAGQVSNEQIMSEVECTGLGGNVVQDATTCPNQETPLGTIAAATTARQQSTSLCCPPEISIFPPSSVANRDQVTRQECTEQLQGIIVGDIGNGAIFSLDYVCESNGQSPIANIVQPDMNSGEPIATEGEVCCGSQEQQLPGQVENDREEVTRQECTDGLDGEIVGDIGDGATRRDDYVCESSGEPSLANIVPAEGEPIAREGEICCAAAASTSINATEAPSDSAAPHTLAIYLYTFFAASAFVLAFFM